MDANKIFEMIKEHEELLQKATQVLNYYYDEKTILNKTYGLILTRRMMSEAIERLEDTINDCEERLNNLYDEYHNLTGKDIIIHEYNDGDTTTSKVRKDVIKSLKERDSNE